MTMYKCVSFYDFSNMNYIIDLTVKNKTDFTNNIKYPRVSLLSLTALVLEGLILLCTSQTPHWMQLYLMLTYADYFSITLGMIGMPKHSGHNRQTFSQLAYWNSIPLQLVGYKNAICYPFYIVFQHSKLLFYQK